MDQFTERNYQAEERRQIKYFGETAAIRRIDFKDSIDMIRVRDIMDDPETQKFITDAKGSTNKDNIKWAQAHSNRFFVYSVSASVNESDPNERGELQGFVSIYSGKDEKRLLKKMIERESIDPDLASSIPYQVVYVSLPDARGKHLMASALRQVCAEMGKIDAQRRREKKFTAVSPDILVFGFVLPENFASTRILKEAGFTKRPGLIQNDKDDPRQSEIYQLDWQKLNKIMHERAEELPSTERNLIKSLKTKK